MRGQAPGDGLAVARKAFKGSSDIIFVFEILLAVVCVCPHALRLEVH